MKRSFISLLLAVVLCLSLCPLALAEENNFSSGSGTSGDPYVITSASQLSNLAKLVNSAAKNGEGNPYATQYYKLGSDISLSGSWTPIGNFGQMTKVTSEITDESSFIEAGLKYGALYTESSQPVEEYTEGIDYYFCPMFAGNFNGAGYTVSGLSISGSGEFKGLFGCVYGAAITKLKIKSASLSASSAVGTVAGAAYQSTITGCSASGSVSGTYAVGGLVGDAYESTISGCTNSVSVQGAGFAGGIVGSLYGGTVSGSSNSASVSASFSSGDIDACAGGIAGGSTGTVKGCLNNGAISASGGTNAYAGGLVGVQDLSGGSSGSASVANCCNTGTVKTSGASKSCAGGVVGGQVLEGSASASISTSYSIGMVTGSSAGGVLGAAGGSSGSVTNCYFLSDTANQAVGSGTASTTASKALSDSELKTQSSYTGFDFTNTWTMNGYAQLRSMSGSRTVTAISVSKRPTQTTYSVNAKSLNSSGGLILVTYSDGSSETISMTDSMISGFDSTKLGSQAITVTYEGATCTFAILVTDKTLQSLSVATCPNKTTYTLGVDTTVELTGGTLLLSYDDGDTETIAMTQTMILNQPDFSTAGSKIVLLNYSGMTASFTVTVSSRSLSSISMYTLPTKTKYTRGESLSVKGGVVKLTFTDQTTDTVSLSESMVSGFQSSNAGSQTLTVTYGGKTCTFDVTVSGGDAYSLTLNMSGISGDTSTVWVDGVAYSASNGTVNLTNANARSAIVYQYNTTSGDAHSQYPTAMYVWVLSFADDQYTATRVSALDNALTYAGSSIRVTGTKGIRMITTVPKSIRNGSTGYTLMEYGTIVGWADKTAKTLYSGGSNTASAVAYKRGNSDPIYKSTSTAVQYTNVLTGFTTDQCKSDLAMRPYMILKDSSGKTITLYGGVVKRSIGFIAYQNRNAFKSGTAAYAYIWDIIHAVYGTAYDSDYKK